MLDGVGQDVKQAVRSLRRAPGLTVVVILTLGIALAASVATFSVVNATLLEALPYREPDRVPAGSPAAEGTRPARAGSSWRRRPPSRWPCSSEPACWCAACRHCTG
jgi:hypothetical protein